MILDRDNWQEIFATIKKNKLRTTLTALGVCWGIFMLVIMLGAGNGLRNGVLKEFEGGATNAFFLWTQPTTKAYLGMRPGRTYNFNNGDAKALAQIPELEIVSPQNQLGGYESSNNVVRGLKTGAFEVSGVYPSIAQVQEVKMKKGRFLNENDIKERRKICVVGSRVIEMLFKPGEDPIGEYIRIKGVYFKIIGTTTAVSSGQEGRQESQKISIPFSTFQQAFNYGDVVGWFAVLAKKNIPASKAEALVKNKLKERHKIAPDDLRAVGSWNKEIQFNKLNGLFTGIEWLIWFVGTGTLLAGIIGVSNIMLIVVKERTKEIGVKRALGATPYMVIMQIMIESVFLTTIAGYFGLLGGIGLLEALNSAIGNEPNGMFYNPTVDLNVALTALSILIVAGAIAGLIPARKAVAVQPVEALRHE